VPSQGVAISVVIFLFVTLIIPFILVIHLFLLRFLRFWLRLLQRNKASRLHQNNYGRTK
jgi:hypothetical protein